MASYGASSTYVLPMRSGADTGFFERRSDRDQSAPPPKIIDAPENYSNPPEN